MDNSGRHAPRLDGLTVPVLTPFTRSDSIDCEAFIQHLDFLHGHGVRRLLVNGTTGEFFSLTREERRELCTLTRDHFDGVVTVHVGFCALPDAVAEARWAEAQGADAVVAAAPFYLAQAPASGVVDYFCAIAEAVTVPLILYNFPKHTQNPLAAESLARIPHYGMKDSSCDLALIPHTPRYYLGGDFPYDPDVQLVHFAGHARFAARWRPLGQPGDTVLDLCMTPAIMLFLIGDALGLDEVRPAAKRTLEFALPIDRPAGGDWWECPLQAPNLLTAGHAAVAYWLGWQVLGDARFRDKGRHFLRALLPFTYLWQPYGKELLYETKPLFGTTGWHYMAWTERCVLWQILLIMDLCDQLGFDWAAFDPDLDWATHRQGTIAAGLRWLVDHQDPDWMHRAEDRTDTILEGGTDMVLADIHDPVDDMYGGIGLCLEPCWVASMIAKTETKENRHEA